MRWLPNGRRDEASPRLRALGELAPFLEGELLEQALGAAGEIKDDEAQTDALRTLAQGLSGHARAAVMQAAFDSLRALSGAPRGTRSAFAIEEMLARLDSPVVAQAYEWALTLDATVRVFSSDRADALNALAPQLSVQRAYVAALGFEEPADRGGGADPARRRSLRRAATRGRS